MGKIFLCTLSGTENTGKWVAEVLSPIICQPPRIHIQLLQWEFNFFDFNYDYKLNMTNCCDECNHYAS